MGELQTPHMYNGFSHFYSNTTFQSTHSGCRLKGFQYDSDIGGFYCSSYDQRNFQSFITADKLLEDGWILTQVINYEDTKNYKVF